jgi:hypothetical protein
LSLIGNSNCRCSGVLIVAHQAWAESYPDYLDLRDRNQNFDDLVACNAAEIGLDTGEDPSRAWAKDLPELH